MTFVSPKVFLNMFFNTSSGKWFWYFWRVMGFPCMVTEATSTYKGTLCLPCFYYFLCLCFSFYFYGVAYIFLGFFLLFGVANKFLCATMRIRKPFSLACLSKCLMTIMNRPCMIDYTRLFGLTNWLTSAFSEDDILIWDCQILLVAS